MGERVFELVFVSPFGAAADVSGPSDGESFDRIYREAVVTACDERQWRPTRREGPFGDASLALLLRADLAVVDVTSSNPNVFYALGLRHSVAGGATMLTAAEDAVLPPVIDQYPVIRYDRTRLDALRDKLVAELDRFEQGDRPGSPIRDALVRAGLATSVAERVAFEQEFNGKLERATDAAQLSSVWHWAKGKSAFGAQQMKTLAARLGARREWATAAAVLERACGEAPDDYECHRMYGDALLRLDRLDAAEDQVRRALALNPADPEALEILGNILRHFVERREEARNAFLEAHELVPSDNWALFNLGRLELLSSSADREKGCERYKVLEATVARTAPATRSVWDNIIRAEALFVIERDDEAFRSYEKAIAHPENADWQVADALEHLKQFASENFRSEAAKVMIARVEAAQPQTSHRTERSPSPGDNPILIHLSDLHFGHRETGGTMEAMHRFSRGGAKTLLDSFKREFSPNYRNAFFSFDPKRMHVVVSGDITYRGDQDEFDWAKEFLEGLCKELKIDDQRERVTIVPGNHDVNWKAEKYKRGIGLDDYLSFLEGFYGPDQVTKLYPAVPWSRLKREPIDPSNIFSVHTSKDGRLQIVGMNTCVHENAEKHWGFLGEEQRDKISDSIEGAKPKPVRIAVMHHHLHPHPQPQPQPQGGPDDALPLVDTSLIRDGGIAEAWLQVNGFDVVLHGHKHRPQLRETLVRGFSRIRRNDDRPLIVCGAGSAGVRGAELDPNVPNQYQVIEFLSLPRITKADFLRLHWRELEDGSSKWTSRQDPWMLQG